MSVFGSLRKRYGRTEYVLAPESPETPVRAWHVPRAPTFLKLRLIPPMWCPPWIVTKTVSHDYMSCPPWTLQKEIRKESEKGGFICGVRTMIKETIHPELPMDEVGLASFL